MSSGERSSTGRAIGTKDELVELIYSNSKGPMLGTSFTNILTNRYTSNEH